MDIQTTTTQPSPATISRVRRTLMGCSRTLVVFAALGFGVGCDDAPALDTAAVEDLELEIDELCGELGDDELLTCVRDLTVAPEAPATNHADESSQGVRIGEVTGYSLEHSLGFIQSGRRQSIYVHSSELGPGTDALEPGDRVSFELMIEPDGFAWARGVELQRL